MTTLHLFYHASPEVGYGHFKRCETLAHEFVRRGCGAQLHNICEIDPKHADISQADYVIADIGSEDIQGIKVVASELQAPCIGIDYFGTELLDLVICGFAHAPPLEGQAVKVSNDFFIIRPEIRSIRQTSRRGYVLVTPGGGDVKNLAPAIIERVSTLAKRVLLIRGPYSKERKFQQMNVEVLHDPENLPKLMAGCDWAVSNGGGAMLELIYLKKPIFAVPQSENEARLSRHFHEQGVIMGVGIDSIAEPTTEQVRSISGDRWIDGSGVERICDSVLRL